MCYGYCMDDAANNAEAPIEPSASQEHSCPDCGQPVGESARVGPVLVCPHCGSQFFPPAPDEADESGEDNSDSPKRNAHHEEELRELRIRQFSTLRRTAYRTRSYFVIGTAACLIVAIQLMIRGVQALHLVGWRGRPIGYFLAAGACLVGMVEFGIRVARVQRGINADLRARELEEIEAASREPDFTPLSDGSQQARNLEQMVGNEIHRGDAESADENPLPHTRSPGTSDS
ncbi:MAG: hypothetical protein JWN51_97 [Phycisphaerales bacterium]|nr:hypothetical protein [Phycisphaerales bacterium]